MKIQSRSILKLTYEINSRYKYGAIVAIQDYEDTHR